MGDPNTADGVELVKTDILDNFAQRHINYAMTHSNLHSNMCGYAGGQLSGYYGCFSAQRALLTYAYFFKYMLDNNLDDATSISDSQTFNTYLFGDIDTPTSEPTIKDFAKAYVGLLDVWESTTGTVAAGDYNEFTEDHENVHYIPMDSKITVAGTQYGVSECLEIAMRSFMLLVGVDGNSTTEKGAGNFTAVSGYTMSSEMPATHSYKIDKWYNETTGNGGPIRYKDEANKVMWDMLKNFSERNVNYGTTWSKVSGYNNSRYTSDYTGCFIPARCQMAFLHFFKTMLDNNYTSFDSTKFTDPVDCTLWGVEAYD